jgi:tRNA U54 and U55 pseudouridine synthase Pus10
MPKISKTAQEQSTDSPIEQVVNLMAQEISISTNPVFICGVNRKINIGNFENIDVYA